MLFLLTSPGIEAPSLFSVRFPGEAVVQPCLQRHCLVIRGGLWGSQLCGGPGTGTAAGSVGAGGQWGMAVTSRISHPPGLLG